MTTQPRKILVTCALPYANGAIHLGHMLEHIQADIWVRFQRMRGNKIHFVCADDAHGTPIMLNADKLGITPEELIAKAKADHIRDFAGFNISLITIIPLTAKKTNSSPQKFTINSKPMALLRVKLFLSYSTLKKICSCLIVL